MGSHRTRTAYLRDVVRQRIATHALVPGDRLPSIRQFAQMMNVSPSTVVEAYDRLVAEGVLVPKKGAGFFVGKPQQSFSMTQVASEDVLAVDPFWVSKQSLDAPSDALKPGCGWFPSSWMPHEALRKAIRNVARGPQGLLSDYGTTRGSSRLRRLLLARFLEEGVLLSPEQIILTGSAIQATDLICRVLLRRGDTVFIDDPCYFNFEALLRTHGVRIVGVPYTQNGPDLDIFEQLAKNENPRLYITNSTLHNPTGVSISHQIAFRIVQIAQKEDFFIIEDDIFADFHEKPSPQLAALDGLERVIRVGSFSKTLSAAVRCGYIAGRKDIVEGVSDMQVATHFGGPSSMITDVIADMLEGGMYRKHMTDVRRRLEHMRSQVIGRLANMDIVPWVVPTGGMYLWCRLPEGKNSTQIALKSKQENIIHAPGNVFSVSQSADSFLRINVTQCSDEKIFSSLRDVLS